MTEMKKTVLLTSGGTGGHFFPAVALAAELKNQGFDTLLVTDIRGLKYQGADMPPMVAIASATPKAGIIAKITAVLKMGAGICQALMLLQKHKPAVVIGFGGYPSVPAVFAAQLIGIPTVVHEQNAAFGKANKWLAGRTAAIAASIENTQGLPEALQNKTRVTGNPVRKSVCDKREDAYAAPQNDGPFNIFVMGGSQGAGIFSEVLPPALASLPENLRRRLRVAQQCRDEDLEKTKKTYAAAGIACEALSFFTDAPERLAACHLFIGRSGASTVAEVTTIGRPAIFVPLMVHADKQQVKNAQALENAGGGWIMLPEEFTVAATAEKIRTLMETPQVLSAAAEKAKSLGRPDATQRLAALVAEIAGKKEGNSMRPFEDTHMRKAA